VREIHKNNNLPFFEIYVATSLKECASRDPKGFYAASAQGTLKGLTGVDSTFEPPQNPDLLLGSDTKEASAEALTEFCLAKLSNIPELPPDGLNKPKIPGFQDINNFFKTVV
jgi:adenylylsulfate kinase-like enzyme